MNTSSQQSRTGILTALIVIIIWGCLPARSTMALKDVLETPTMKTDLAVHFSLQAVVRAGNRLVVVGERGHILYSDDEGNSWTQAEVPMSANLNSVHFPSARQGWAVGHEGVVLYSKDGGETWAKQLDGFEAAKIALNKTQKDLAQLKIASCSTAADPTMAFDMASWRFSEAQRDIKIGPAKPFMDVWFKNPDEGFIVGAYGYFFHTTDGGKTWEDVATKLNNPDGMHLYSIKGQKDGLVFIVGEAGNAFRSTDGGGTWENVMVGYEGGLFGLFFSDHESRVYIYGLRGNIFRSEDQGITWRHWKNGSSANLYGGLCIGEEKFLMVGQGGILLVCNGTNGACRPAPRTDRRALHAAIAVGKDKLLLVGEGGIDFIASGQLTRQ